MPLPLYFRGPKAGLPNRGRMCAHSSTEPSAVSARCEANARHRSDGYCAAMPSAPAKPEPWRAPSPLPTACHTHRIRLRSWRPSDAPAMLEALSVDRPSFLPWLPWTATDNRTVEECKASIARFEARNATIDPAPTDYVLAILEAGSDKVLGGTGLHRMAHAMHEAEIGYWMRADRRRQGLCSEAVAALVAWAFRSPAEGGWGLRRIHIRCAALNGPSAVIPKRLGFVHEATLRQDRWVDGSGWDDTLVFGMLHEEWRGEPMGFAIER